jgi:hypothetical protein
MLETTDRLEVRAEVAAAFKKYYLVNELAKDGGALLSDSPEIACHRLGQTFSPLVRVTEMQTQTVQFRVIGLGETTTFDMPRDCHWLLEPSRGDAENGGPPIGPGDRNDGGAMAVADAMKRLDAHAGKTTAATRPEEILADVGVRATTLLKAKKEEPRDHRPPHVKTFEEQQTKKNPGAKGQAKRPTKMFGAKPIPGQPVAEAVSAQNVTLETPDTMYPAAVVAASQHWGPLGNNYQDPSGSFLRAVTGSARAQGIPVEDANDQAFERRVAGEMPSRALGSPYIFRPDAGRGEVEYTVEDARAAVEALGFRPVIVTATGEHEGQISEALITESDGRDRPNIFLYQEDGVWYSVGPGSDKPFKLSGGPNLHLGATRDGRV